jgi:NADH-quinone oxidoreductase subunit L
MRARSGRAAIFTAPENHVLHDSHHAPTWVKLSPFVAMLIGLAWRSGSTSRAGPAEGAGGEPGPLYQFLLNKWWFDEIYDRSSCARHGAGPVPVEEGRRRDHRRGDQRAGDGHRCRSSPGSRGGAVGLSLHYAFVMVIGISLLITWYAVTGG